MSASPTIGARDLPVNRGLYNFDRIRIEFYRERQAAFEAFKKGDVLYRQEFTSRVWATGYDFPAIDRGQGRQARVSRREAAVHAGGGGQPAPRAVPRSCACARRSRCASTSNGRKRNLFYGAYERSQSCFERSDYKAEGLPSPEELALLEPLRDKLPPEAFGEAVMQPVSDGSGRDRKLLGAGVEAARRGRLEARRRVARQRQGRAADGWKSWSRTTASSASISPWVENMRAIGIDASIRMVDSAQYQARQADFDFDLMLDGAVASARRRRATSSRPSSIPARPALPGSRNLPGTADPAVDALVDAVGEATDREQLITSPCARSTGSCARGMDWIPNWYSANHRAAFWDMFGFKEPKPDYGFPVEALWWFDKDKAAAIGKG